MLTFIPGNALHPANGPFLRRLIQKHHSFTFTDCLSHRSYFCTISCPCRRARETADTGVNAHDARQRARRAIRPICTRQIQSGDGHGRSLQGYLRGVELFEPLELLLAVIMRWRYLPRPRDRLSASRITRLSETRELAGDIIWLVESDAQLGRAPIAIAAGEKV